MIELKYCMVDDEKRRHVNSTSHSLFLLTLASLLDSLWNNLHDNKLYNWKERKTNLCTKHSKDFANIFILVEQLGFISEPGSISVTCCPTPLASGDFLWT